MQQPKRRFTEQHPHGRPNTLAADHKAVVGAVSLFHSQVREPDDVIILKSGEHQRKIGSHVTKGKWRGMPIFTLTLEERATCPSSCQHWRDCYGNNMHWSKRLKHGPLLEETLDREICELAREHPAGFVVRLHILGDFYSPQYVGLWGLFLDRHPNLHIFGYTAYERDSDIGKAMQILRNSFPERWWVRWSHRDKETPLSTGDSGIVCPAQTGATDCCGTCGLCWTVNKPIKFLIH